MNKIEYLYLCSNLNKLGFKTYKEYLNSNIWLNFKIKYFKKNEKSCVRCQSIKKINLHHLTYKNLGNEKFEDVESLCRKCHKKEHNIIIFPKFKSKILKKSKKRNQKRKQWLAIMAQKRGIVIKKGFNENELIKKINEIPVKN